MRPVPKDGADDEIDAGVRMPFGYRAAMPRGMMHEETGSLEFVRGFALLRRDGGGTWRLDLGPIQHLRARRLAGRRVRVVGVRDQFDLLAVRRLCALTG